MADPETIISILRSDPSAFITIEPPLSEHEEQLLLSDPATLGAGRLRSKTGSNTLGRIAFIPNANNHGSLQLQASAVANNIADVLSQTRTAVRVI